MIYLLVECSHCDAMYKTPQGTRQEVWFQAKQQGWTLGIKGEHLCPDCTKHISEAKAVQQ